MALRIRFQRFGVLVLGEVSSLKFLPLCLVVSEPLPQLRAWSCVLEPRVEVEVFLFDSARPEALDEKAGSLPLRATVATWS